jgi:hypothetical protein
MFIVLAILSRIFWTITYLLIIQRSIQDKSVGMPMAAICMNIAWEFIFSFILPSNKPQLYSGSRADDVHPQS